MISSDGNNMTSLDLVSYTKEVSSSVPLGHNGTPGGQASFPGNKVRLVVSNCNLVL